MRGAEQWQRGQRLSDWSLVSGGGFRNPEAVERAHRAAGHHLQNMRVDHGGTDIAVSQQHVLDEIEQLVPAPKRAALAKHKPKIEKGRKVIVQIIGE